MGKYFGKKRLSKVAWSKIKNPKNNGGLGFRNICMVKLAGIKACWTIFKQPESFCSTPIYKV